MTQHPCPFCPGKVGTAMVAQREGVALWDVLARCSSCGARVEATSIGDYSRKETFELCLQRFPAAPYRPRQGWAR